MSLVKKLQPGGDITNPTIPKPAIQKKIKLNIDGQEREFDQEDIDSMYSNILGGLDDKNKEYGRQYLEKLNTALQQGNARVNVGGKTALKMEVDPSIGYQQENQMYSEQELKKLYPNKADRQSFKERSNVVQGIHRQLGDLIASKYSGIKEEEGQKAAEQKAKNLQSSLDGISRHSSYSSSMFGKEGEGKTGQEMALQTFAKMNPAQRQNALRKWMSNYASQIYNLDDKNEELSNKFKEIYGQSLVEVKAKLSPYFLGGKFNAENANLGNVADILQNRLIFNTFLDKDQLARWKSGQFGQVADQTVPTTTETTVPATQSTFTGVKGGIQYSQGQPIQGMHQGKYYIKGKLFTGYAKPNLLPNEEGLVNYENAYNEANYGGFIGGKRMSDTEFRNYYNKLNPEQKKQFSGYEDVKASMYTPSKAYTDLSTIPMEKGNIASFLKLRGHRYAQDVTDLYAHQIPKSRIIAVYDRNKALTTGTPWAKNISHYRVFRDKNGGLQYEPVTINRGALGDETISLPSGNKWFLGKASDTGVTGSEFKLPEYKSGGEIKKLAQGGAGLIINERVRAFQPNKVKEALAARANKQATLGDIYREKWATSDQLSSADRYKLGALGADLVSAVAAFTPIPGSSFVAGGAGMAGTISSAIAESKDNDGFSWGDAGRAAVGLGLDAATMIPGIGLGAKFIKLGKTVKGAATTLKVAGMALKAAGYADAGRAVYKLLESGGDPSKMNIDDLRSAINGIKMVSLGFKGSVRAKTIAPTQEVKSFDIKDKEGKIFTTRLSAEDELKLSQIESPIEKNAFLKSLAKQKHNIENIDSYGIVQKKSITPFRSEGSLSWKPIGRTSSPLMTSKNEVQNANLTEDGAIGLNWAQRKLYGKKQMAQDYAFFNKTKQGVPPEKAAAEAKSEVDKIEESISQPTVQVSQPSIQTITPEVVTPGSGQILLAGRVGPRGVGRAVKPSSGRIIYVNSPEPPSRPLLNATNAQNQRPLTSNEQAWYMMERMRNTPVEPSRRMPYQLTAQPRRYGKSVQESGLGTIYSTGKVPLQLTSNLIQRGRPVSQSSGQTFYSQPGQNQIIIERTAADIYDYQNQFVGYSSPLYKNGGKVIFAQKGRSSFIRGLGEDVVGGMTKKALGEIQLEKKQKPLITPLQESFKKAVEQKNIATRSLVGLGTALYQQQPKKNFKLGDLSQNTFGLDLARTLAGNIANQQFDQTIATPQYQNVAESYLATPSTSLRDAASIASQQYINRGPQTSDAILNQKIQISNIDKANRLKMQGEAEYSNAFEQNRQRNAGLAQEFAQQRATVANQNAAAQADAENKRIQLANTVRGLNAENLQNFATRWITKSEQDKLQNKGINTELALNELSNQTYEEQNKMLNRYNYLNSLEAAGQLTPELSNEKNDLEKKYAAYNALTKNISLNIYKNPNYQYNLLEEKKKVGLSKAGGLLQIENKYNLRRAEDINKSLQTKYNLTVKNNLELLKDILKSAKR